MGSSFEKMLQTLILRHRSVAVLIHRGHLDDARLLLAQLVEDIVALTTRMERFNFTEELRAQANFLHETIAPGSLAPGDVKRLSRLNSLCLRHIRALTAHLKPTTVPTNRIVTITTVSLMILCAAFWIIPTYLQAQKCETALKNLEFLAQVAYIAKIKTNKNLVQITGNNCSECPCRDTISMQWRTDVCRDNWIKALAAIWQAASGESPFNVHGGIILESRFLRDPWGSPYALNEHEGEGPGACLPDSLRSAGPDGILHTPDDIVVSVKTLCTPVP